MTIVFLALLPFTVLGILVAGVLAAHLILSTRRQKRETQIARDWLEDKIDWDHHQREWVPTDRWKN